MSGYAIGDIQGCYAELNDLLDKVSFGSSDELWLLGDLVNRGPRSLSTLRMLHGLRAQIRTVLGNHDLHLLAIAHGGHRLNRGDTFADVLEADDRDELLAWLRGQPLLVRDRARGLVMAHAGVPHIWSLDVAEQRATEVAEHLAHGDYLSYFEQLYGNVPDCWRDDLTGMDRLRLITNYFTRMRFIDSDGRLDFVHKGAPDTAPPELRPWFTYTRAEPETLLFGHWAAIDGVTGRDNILALDTGCVWGRALTALNLDTHERISVPARNADSART